MHESFTCNSILLKLSLKNRGILLNSFKIRVICCIVCELRANAHFPPTILGSTFSLVQTQKFPSLVYQISQKIKFKLGFLINKQTQKRFLSTKSQLFTFTPQIWGLLFPSVHLKGFLVQGCFSFCVFHKQRAWVPYTHWVSSIDEFFQILFI